MTPTLDALADQPDLARGVPRETLVRVLIACGLALIGAPTPAVGGMRHRVYVPKRPDQVASTLFLAYGGADRVVRGSGIVGKAALDGLLQIDFEGAIYGQEMRYAEKVLHAAGRQAAKYPTVARLWLDPLLLEPVGWYDDELGVVSVDDLLAEELVAEWCGMPWSELVATHQLEARGAKWRR